MAHISFGGLKSHIDSRDVTITKSHGTMNGRIDEERFEKMQLTFIKRRLDLKPYNMHH